MRRFSLFNLLVAAAFAAGVGAVSLSPQPGYADSSSDSCSGMSGQDRRDCENENNRADRELYFAAYWLAKTGKYEAAIDMLQTVENKNNPAVLNYIGYSTRKLGDVDGALVYYNRALKIAPNYTLARAYMGEAFLMKGDLARADEQLSEIGKRCGTDCQEYGNLAGEIAKYKIARG